MSLVTAQQLTRISKGKPSAANVKGIVEGINLYGPDAGLDQPHRLTQFVTQVMHESNGLVNMKEIWGPTAAQKRYEGRKDLGNTQKGDGSKYRGYGPIQLTGRDNVTRFYKWCLSKGYNVPNFVDHPELIATHPWAILSAIWFWSIGNRTKKSLNLYADKGDIENITQVVNGGLNGYPDRLDYYDRTALVFLGYGPNDLMKFQLAEGLTIDKPKPLSGPLTRAAFQKELLKLTSKDDQAAKVQTAPAVQKITKTVEVDKPVVPVAVEKQVKKKSNFMSWLLGFLTVGGGSVSKVFDADWQTVAAIGGVGIVAIGAVILLRHQLIGAVKELRDGLNS